jgi:hypothetical protein
MMLMEVVDFHTKNFPPHFSTNHQPREVQVPDQADHKVVATETQKLSLNNSRISSHPEELEV